MSYIPADYSSTAPSPSDWVNQNNSDRSSTYSVVVFFFLALHIPIGVIMKQNPMLAAVHAFGSLGIGLLWLAIDRQPFKLIYITAYITGSEVLWRASNAPIFWEFGKYAVSLLLALAMFRYHKLANASKLGLMYFLLLVPAIALMPTFDREAISWSLSGPFSMAIAIMFFSTVHLTNYHLRRLLLALCAPVVGLAFLTAFETISAGTIAFRASSLSVTSAGYGPNQVSSILGLGALAVLLYIFSDQDGYISLKVILVGLVIWLGVQSALTFSRSGLWTMLGSIVGASGFLFRDSRSRINFLVTGIGVFFIVAYLVYPSINELTNGTLETRFLNTEPTGRLEAIAADLQAFQDHWLTGIGVGQANDYHDDLGLAAGVHTEYSRLLAEHGLFGFGALLMLFFLVVQRLRLGLPPLEKAFIISVTVWALLYMTHAAMRLVAPSLMFGLGSAVFSEYEDPVERTLSEGGSNG